MFLAHTILDSIRLLAYINNHGVADPNHQKEQTMSNNQSYLDNGTLRDVRVVAFDVEGNMEYGEALGRVATYAEALAMVKNAGYTVAPETEGYDVGHIATPDGPDAYGIPTLEHDAA